MKPEMVEGPQAASNFKRAMKTVFRVSKTDVIKAGKKQKERKRKKR